MSPLKKRPLPRSVWTLSFVSFLADVSDEMMYPLLPLFLIGVLGSSKTQLGAMEGVAILIVSLMSAYAGVLSDRIGRWRIIATGWSIYAASYVGFALLPNSFAWGMWPLMAFYGVYMALTDGINKALIADHAPKEHCGAALGLFYALAGVTTLLASLLTGVV